MTEANDFAGIAPGAALPELALAITRADLVRFAGAADDYMPQHWDQPMMIAAGFADVVVHGWLCCAHMCRCVTDWATPRGAILAAYHVTYRQPLYPGPLTCGGEVVAAEAGEVTLELWARDGLGQTVTRATARLRPADAAAELRGRARPDQVTQ